MKPSAHNQPDVSVDALTRRSFIKTSSLAALLAGCDRRAPQDLVGYVDHPSGWVPGELEWFASSALRRGYAVGILGRVRDHRPIKVDGHPEHPMSQGSTGAQEEALLYSLYDRKRIRNCRYQNKPSDWKAARAVLGRARQAGETSSKIDAVVLPATTSQRVGAAIAQLRQVRPNTKIYFDPSDTPTGRWRAGAVIFGRPADPQYAFDKAERVLTLDAELMISHPAALRWARDLASRRAPESPRDAMSRIYAVAPAPSPTTVFSDHHICARASDIAPFAARVLHHLSVFGEQQLASSESDETGWRELVAKAKVGDSLEHMAKHIARDLWSHGGRALVVAGETQPAATHVLAFLLNKVLGNAGRTVRYAPCPVLGAGTAMFDLEELCNRLESEQVRRLVMACEDPVHRLPGSLDFQRQMARAEQRFCLASHESATTESSDLVIPKAHVLECWGDAIAYDGTATVQQPMLTPFGESQSLEQLLLAMSAEPEQDARAGLARHFGPDARLEHILSRGFEDDRSSTEQLALQEETSSMLKLLGNTLSSDDAPYELVFRPDPVLGTGEGVHNAWLQELPDPITSLSWQDAALVHPETAKRWGAGDGDKVAFAFGESELTLPILALPGVESHSVVVHLGRPGSVHAARPYGAFSRPLTRVRRAAGHTALIRTQHHFAQHGAEAALHLLLSEWKRQPRIGHAHPPPTLYADRSIKGLQWGMTIDLGACMGCGACVVACQSENNTPAVGPAQTAAGRQMHWLRIDTYVRSDEDAQFVTQPMACQHCEHAPCEYVCPTGATSHSQEGLNQMVYNRCVGTRFCSNNCPYKVRRFNFAEYNGSLTPREKLRHNPDVTVRARGVMEKCTYCVQRIERARIASKTSESTQALQVRTACQQACPTQAITFGNIHQRDSEVAKKRSSLRSYAVLRDLGTRPRTRYLAKISNPNPELK